MLSELPFSFLSGYRVVWFEFWTLDRFLWWLNLSRLRIDKHLKQSNYWHTKPENGSTSWTSQYNRTSQVCCAHQCWKSFVFLWQWEGQRSPLIWSAEPLHLFRSSRPPTGCWFPARQSSSSNSRAECFLWEEMFLSPWTGKCGPAICQQYHHLTVTEFLLWGFVKEEVCWTSETSSARSKLTLSTEIRTFRSEIFENIWIYLKFRMQAVILKFGGHVQHQLHSI